MDGTGRGAGGGAVWRRRGRVWARRVGGRGEERGEQGGREAEAARWRCGGA